MRIGYSRGWVYADENMYTSKIMCTIKMLIC